MPVLPTTRGKGSAWRNSAEDSEAHQRLLLHEQLSSPKPQVVDVAPPPHGQTLPPYNPQQQQLESPIMEAGVASPPPEPHHSPAGYCTPPEERQLRQRFARGPIPLPLPPPGATSVPYQRLGDSIDEAVHQAQLKRRFQHHQPQQQIFVVPRSGGSGEKGLQDDPAGEKTKAANASEQQQRQKLGHPRAQPIMPALPDVTATGQGEGIGGAGKKKAPTTTSDSSRTVVSPPAATTVVTSTPVEEEEEDKIAGEAEVTQVKKKPFFDVWGAVEGAAAALSRLRIGVPHAPMVVTPTHAPFGFSFESVDGHRMEDPRFHNPPDAAALAESEAAREVEAADAAGTGANAPPSLRSRFLDALVAGISRFGVLGIHHPVGMI